MGRPSELRAPLAQQVIHRTELCQGGHVPAVRLGASGEATRPRVEGGWVGYGEVGTESLQMEDMLWACG